MSIPINIEELSLTEGRGTGIPAIYRELSKNGSPSPLFNTDDPDRRFFFIELLAHPYFKMSEKTSEKIRGENEKTREKTGEKILILLKKDSTLTIKELAQKIERSESAVENSLIKLKTSGKLKRYGTKGGYWEVIEEDHDPFETKEKTEKLGRKMSEEMSEEILQAIRQNRQVTIAELASEIGVVTRTIERKLKMLQESGQVSRIGPDKGGYWEVTSKVGDANE